MRCCVLVVCLAMLSACVGTVPSRYEIRDLRVISVVAEPPEVAPGETVTLMAYFEDVNGGDTSGVAASMGQCSDPGTQERDVDCVGTSAEIALASTPSTSTADLPADAFAAGLPLFRIPHVYFAQFTETEPANVLDGLAPIAARYGYYDRFIFHGQDSQRSIDASKRVVVTAPGGQAKNQNPTLFGLDVLDGNSQPEALPTLSPGTAYTLRPNYDAASLEAYSVVDYTGAVLNFVEEASFVWSCAPSCTIDHDTSYGPQTIELSLPKDWSFGATLLVNVVMRDGRGGEVPFVRSFGVAR